VSVASAADAGPARRHTPWLGRAEALIAGVLVLLFCSTRLLTALYGLPEALPPGAANPYRRVFLLSYAGILALAAANWRSLGSLARQLPLLWLFHGLTLASILWSVQPGATLRGAVALLMTSLFALVLHGRFGAVGAARVVLAVLLLLVISSFVLLAIAPGQALHQMEHAGLLHGVFGHKNVAGNVLALAVPALVLVWQGQAIGPRRAMLCTLLILVFIALTGSKTSLLVVVMAFGVALAAPLSRGDLRVFAAMALAAGALGGILVTLAVTAPEMLTQAVGKDATFTGRTFIWQELAALVAERPMLGHGYSALWDLQYGPLYRFVEEWGINAGHNAFLDLTVDLGLAGLLLFLAMIGAAALRSALALRYGDRQLGLYALTLLGVLGLLSVSETVLPVAHRLHWVCLVLALLAARQAPLILTDRSQQRRAQAFARKERRQRFDKTGVPSLHSDQLSYSREIGH